MGENDALHENFAKEISGEIVHSENPGGSMRKWRIIFKISQSCLAAEMNISSSVLSDYESGRRKSPGIFMLRKIVNALLSIDERTGAQIAARFSNNASWKKLSDVIVSVRELNPPRTVNEINLLLNGKIIASANTINKNINGYVIIDSASMGNMNEISSYDFMKFKNLVVSKALLFAGARHKESMIIPTKMANLRPEVLVLQGIKKLDELDERIASIENMPVIISNMSTTDEMIAALKKL